MREKPITAESRAAAVQMAMRTLRRGSRTLSIAASAPKKQHESSHRHGQSGKEEGGDDFAESFQLSGAPGKLPDRPWGLPGAGGPRAHRRPVWPPAPVELSPKSGTFWCILWPKCALLCVFCRL